jgi:hypothetical protein
VVTGVVEELRCVSNFLVARETVMGDIQRAGQNRQGEIVMSFKTMQRNAWEAWDRAQEISQEGSEEEAEINLNRAAVALIGARCISHSEYRTLMHEAMEAVRDRLAWEASR